ncbi:autotransporter domain-containing protein, partial [Mariniblastus sp.]|nr:autotransporter domain-containing protein [Mariniblastus sp.]
NAGDGGLSFASNGQNGVDFSGGGGGGDDQNGGAGSDFGGGGGGGERRGGGNSGLFSGSGGAGAFSIASDASSSFGGSGGNDLIGGQGGDAVGGAVFVRNGGTLNIIDSGIANSTVTGGTGGVSAFFDPNGSNGAASGSGVYLHGDQTMGISVSDGNTTNIADDIVQDSGNNATINKTGSGVLQLGGSNRVSTVNVNAGQLAVNGSLVGNLNVNSNGTLSGSGNINGLLTNGGNLNVGNSIGTLNTTGYASQSGQDSTITVEVRPSANPVAGTDNDLLVVSGSADLAGNDTVHVTSETAADNNSNAYTIGAKYTFLQANSISGTIENVTDDLAFFDATLGSDGIFGLGQSYFFTLRANGTNFSDQAMTFNQLAVATAIDQASMSPGSGLQSLVSGTSKFTTNQVQQLLGQVGGDAFASNQNLRVQGTSMVLQSISNKVIQQMNSPWSRSSTGGFSITDVAGPAAGTTSDDSTIGLVSYVQPVATASPVYQPRNPWQGWVSGYGIGGSVDSDGNAGGVDYGLGGVTAGMQRRVDDFGGVGLFGGYTGSNLTGQTNPHNIRSNSGHFGGFLTRNDDLGYALLMGGFQFDGFDSTRSINVGGIDSSAEADYDGWQGFSYAEKGWNVPTGRALALQPYGGLQYLYTRQDGFDETGAGALNLSVNGLDSNSLRSLLGTRVSMPLAGSGWRREVVPTAHVAWMHEFLDTNTLVATQFAGGTSITQRGVSTGRDWLVTGAGVNLLLAPGLTARLDYTAQLNDRQDLHMGSGQLQWQW